MTIRTKVTIAGTTYEDYRNMRVERSIGDYNASSSFSIILDSPYGRHKDDFTVGDEVIIYADQDATPTTKIFTGVLENIKFQGKGNTQRVKLSGRDYSARLQDITVKPVVFTDTEISSIVTTILSDNEISDITTTNVNTTNVTLARIAFNHKSVFEAIKQLAELAGFIFYVDVDKDLHFEEEQSISSGIKLDNTNITALRFDSTREGMYNKLWVYGDRYLAGFKEILSTDGGSVYTLVAKPHNTYVEYTGTSLRGGVYQMMITPTSGFDYLVNFHDRQIILQSGTDLGYGYLPPAGGSLLVEYKRDVPIVKYGQDDTSIALYGPKEKVIEDKSIKDPQTAIDILRKKLEEASPLKQFEADLKGWFTFNPGETVEIVMDDFNIDETDVTILNISYSFDKNTIQSEDIITVRLSKKIMDITDKIKDLDERVKNIEGSDLQDTDVLTRLMFDKASTQVVGSYWAVWKIEIGSSFILGHSTQGRLGSYATHSLGEWRTGGSTLSFSGGYSY